MHCRRREAHVSNSDLTSTTRRLSQAGVYSSGNVRRSKPQASVASRTPYSDEVNSNAGAASDVSLDMDFKKSVTFNKYNSDSGVSTSTDQASNNPSIASDTVYSVNGDISSAHDSDLTASFTEGTKKWLKDSTWFTGPSHHITAAAVNDENHSGYSADKMALAGTVSSRMASSEPLNGTLTNDIPTSNHSSAAVTIPSLSAASIDRVAKEYFPVTLGAAYAITSERHTKSSKTQPPPSKGLSQPNPVPWKVKRSKSPRRKPRPGSAQSSSSSNSKSSIDKMYLLAGEAPATGMGSK